MSRPRRVTCLSHSTASCLYWKRRVCSSSLLSTYRARYCLPLPYSLVRSMMCRGP